MRWRSVRWRMLAMAAAITAFPIVLVSASFVLDEGTEDRMRGRVRAGAGDVAHVLARDGAIDRETLDAIAEEHAIRVRVIQGASAQEADHEGSRLARVFFADDGGPTLREVDATLGPLPDRAESIEAARIGASVGCRTAHGGRLAICHAARQVRVGEATALVYAQESSRRSIRALFDLRYQLLKLTLVVLPLSLLLAWWLGRRFVRPIESLRARVRAHAGPGGSFAVDAAGDELDELSADFDHLVLRLDARTRATEAFVADVAHELKSPVATVRACAETLEDRELDPARAARLARALLGSARRMEALLSQLLELARAEAGMPDAERAPVRLERLAREVVDEAALRHPEVRFALEVRGDGAHVLGVPGALRGALANLVDNAACFGHSVRVRVQTDDPVRCTVTDDGPGIAPADLPRVFDRFFTTRSRDEGTGLGLALVRAVVEAHGGRVEAASFPGEGARFTVTLPAHRASRFTSFSSERDAASAPAPQGVVRRCP